MLVGLLLQPQKLLQTISCHHYFQSTNTFVTRTISRSLFAITITNSRLILLVHLHLQFSSASDMTAAAAEMQRFVRMKVKVYRQCYNAPMHLPKWNLRTNTRKELESHHSVPRQIVSFHMYIHFTFLILHDIYYAFIQDMFVFVFCIIVVLSFLWSFWRFCDAFWKFSDTFCSMFIVLRSRYTA